MTQTELIKELKSELLFLLESVKESDKTPRYDYSGKDKKNRRGVEPGGGARWFTPFELAQNTEGRLKLKGIDLNK